MMVIKMTDVITGQTVVMDSDITVSGGWTILLTPFHRAYDTLKVDPTVRLYGRIFTDILYSGGMEDGLKTKFIKITQSVHSWIKSTKKNTLPNLNYNLVHFKEIMSPLEAFELVADYRKKHNL